MKDKTKRILLRLLTIFDLPMMVLGVIILVAPVLFGFIFNALLATGFSLVLLGGVGHFVKRKLHSRY